MKAQLEPENEDIFKAIVKTLEQDSKEITLEDVKGYCKPRCLTIISNELYHELTHSKIKALEQEPIIDKINKMKSEIADSLEFWDYSPNNNPLARDILETVTNFWGDIREEEE